MFYADKNISTTNLRNGIVVGVICDNPTLRVLLHSLSNVAQLIKNSFTKLGYFSEVNWEGHRIKVGIQENFAETTGHRFDYQRTVIFFNDSFQFIALA